MGCSYRLPGNVTSQMDGWAHSKAWPTLPKCINALGCHLKKYDSTGLTRTLYPMTGNPETSCVCEAVWSAVCDVKLHLPTS